MKSMKWYKTLSVFQKIDLKDYCKIITGISFDKLSYFFTFKEKINIIYNKLKLEGFDL